MLNRKFKTLLSACWLLTSATLCVELKRAVSPARTQCWWVQFRSSGKYKGGWEIYQNDSNNTINNQRQNSKEERTRKTPPSEITD